MLVDAGSRSSTCPICFGSDGPRNIYHSCRKWTGIKHNFEVEDIMLIVDETTPRNSWIMGKVIQAFPDRRGFVRQLLNKTKTSSLERPITKVCLLQEAEI